MRDRPVYLHQSSNLLVVIWIRVSQNLVSQDEPISIIVSVTKDRQFLKAL